MVNCICDREAVNIASGFHTSGNPTYQEFAKLLKSGSLVISGFPNIYRAQVGLVLGKAHFGVFGSELI